MAMAIHSTFRALLPCLSLLLLASSIASMVLTLQIRSPPTPWGWMFLIVSSISAFSALLSGLISVCTDYYFSFSYRNPQNLFFLLLHLFLLFVSLIGQATAFLLLFANSYLNMRYLKPHSTSHGTRVLIKLDGGLFLAMFCSQLAAVALECAAFNCAGPSMKDDLLSCKDLEARNAARGKNMARVQQESMDRAKKKETEAVKELNQKMREKYGKWTQEGEFDS